MNDNTTAFHIRQLAQWLRLHPTPGFSVAVKDMTFFREALGGGREGFQRLPGSWEVRIDKTVDAYVKK